MAGAPFPGTNGPLLSHSTLQVDSGAVGPAHDADEALGVHLTGKATHPCGDARMLLLTRPSRLWEKPLDAGGIST